MDRSELLSHVDHTLLRPDANGDIGDQRHISGDRVKVKQGGGIPASGRGDSGNNDLCTVGTDTHIHEQREEIEYDQCPAHQAEIGVRQRGSLFFHVAHFLFVCPAPVLPGQGVSFIQL